MDSNENSIWKVISGKSKFIFPVVVVIAIAITVIVALTSKSKKSQIVEEMADDNITSIEEEMVKEVYIDYDSIPLVKSTDQELNQLIADYFDAQADGDIEKLRTLVDKLDEGEAITFEENAKYIESNIVSEIYTKQGYEEGSYLVFPYYYTIFKGREEIKIPGISGMYVETNDQGKYYVRNLPLTEEVNNYAKILVSKEDVTDLFNRNIVEYNEVMTEHPEIKEYANAVREEVRKQVGTILAQKNEESKASDEEVAQTNESVDPNAAESSEVTPVEEKPVEVYAQTKSAVNVRASDSEKADKVGKATKGLKVKVLEQRENGWSKVIFEDKEAFIKSEFLNVLEQAANVESAGKVKAKSNVNVRSAADKESTSLGILVGGDEADLVSTEGEWTKIKYKDQIGYVMSEFLE